MRKVLVSFEVNVAQSSEHPLILGAPDFRFCGSFDRDDEKSFIKMCDLEYQVKELASSLKSLGCQVSVLRKEESSLNF